MTAVLTFDDLTLGYDRHPAVHHLDGVVEKGDLLAVIGPNGAGKSTLLKGVMGQLRPLSGAINRHGLKRQDIAYMPQQAGLDLSFPLTVFDMVAMGLWCSIGGLGAVDADPRNRVGEALERVGLEGFGDRIIGTLSRGQFQRALFARLLLQDSNVILLDEPFTAIDQKTEDDLSSIVAAWRGEGRTVISVLHDIDQVRRLFPKTLLLARDPIAWGATTDVVCKDNLRAAHALSEAWDDDAADCAPPGVAA
ncbi:MAG: ABC transporter ATP-binding protein [Rhodospirillaceae bacterium]|nr:ABC transporter ATP-binding protein [Rhodospirillaceae bacterium]MBT6511294.1 ABC transporter ATP-binding protein [Rhodospirillaceae bacterium]MBT7648505.1 ABC transporter ATP-binding protein [Rhodospirillaceae bacterium]